MVKKDQFWLYLSCKDSLHFNPNNKANNFIVVLPEPIEIQGKWEVALTGIVYLSPHKGKKSPKFLLVYSDVCEDTVINGSKLPLLHRIFTPDHKG